MVFSRDGKELFAAGRDGVVRFDATTGKRLARFHGTCRSVGWVDDDTLSLEGGDAKGYAIVELWNAKRGVKVGSWKFRSRGSISQTVSADGAMVATAGYHESIRIWQARTGKAIASFADGDSPPSGMQFVPGKRQLITSSSSKATLWDIDTGRKVRTFPLNSWAGFWLGPRGVLMGGRGGKYAANIWDLRTGKRVLKLEGHASWVSAGAFTPDAKTFVAAAGGKLVFWDIASGKRLRTWDFGAPRAEQILYSSDGARLAVATSNSDIAVWNVATGKLLANVAGHTNLPTSMFLSADAKRLVSTSMDNTIRVWNVATGRQTRVIRAPENLRHAAMGSKGDTLFTEHGSAIRAWNLATGKTSYSLKSLPGITRGLAAAGHRIVAIAEPHVVDIDIARKRVVAVSAYYQVNVKGAVSTNARVAVVAGGNVAALVDARTGKQVATLPTPTCDRIDELAVSPDGRVVVSTDAAGELRMWNGKNGAIGRGVILPNEYVTDLAVSPAGAYVAAAGSKHVVVWVTGTNKLLAIAAPPGWATVAFGPQGRHLLVGFSDGTITVWKTQAFLANAKPLAPGTQEKREKTCKKHRPFNKGMPDRRYKPVRVGDSLEPTPPPGPVARPTPKGVCSGNKIDLRKAATRRKCKARDKAKRVTTTRKQLSVKIPPALHVVSGQTVTIPITMRNLTGAPLDVDISMLFDSPLNYSETRHNGRVVRPKMCGLASTVGEIVSIRLAKGGVALASTTWTANTGLWPSFKAMIESGNTPCRSVKFLEPGEYTVTFQFDSDSDSDVIKRRTVTSKITVTR